MMTVTPCVRNYKEKRSRSGIIDRSQEKRAMREAELRRIQEEQVLMRSYIREERLE